MRFTDLAAVTGGSLLDIERGELVFRGVSIDSREVQPGELFIAIRGEKQDGHRYIEQALENGAAGVIVEVTYSQARQIADDVAVVTVVNSHQAMIDLAKNYRNSLTGRFIGITGSNGKTTTKELAFRLIRAVEKSAYCSPGNLNNLYGVPLSLFAVEKEAKAVVVEMGISTRNEMPTLAQIVHPDVIVITNVGPSHLEFLDTVEDVARAKLELVRQAKSSVPVIINGDDALLVEETKKVRKNFKTFALNSDANFTVEAISMHQDGTSTVSIDGHLFRLALVGRHQVYNLLAAYAAFKTLDYSFTGVDTETISLDTAPMRGQRVVKHEVTFVADCYNANPGSVQAGLEAYFAAHTTGRRIVVLGDMLELGALSEHYHRQVGALLARYRFDRAFLVGRQAALVLDEAVKHGMSVDLFEHHETAAQAAASVKSFLRAGDFVYVKGSRGIGLETVLNIFDKAEESS